MSNPLVDLLGSLSDLFAPGGGLRLAAFERALASGWAGPELKAALSDLLAADPTDLDVAYADHFLYSSWHPVLHLEASVQTLGHLCDGELLAHREALHRSMGVTPPPGRCADHLASGLAILASGLAILAREPDDPERTAALRLYVSQHLVPQVRGLQSLGLGRPLHPVYAAGLTATLDLLDELGPALAGPGTEDAESMND